MKIRTAKKTDRKELLRLYDLFMETDRYSRGRNDAFAQVLQDRNKFIFVAEEKGRLVAFVSFSARLVVRYSRRIGQIEELFVQEEFRKKGIGKKLIKAAEGAAERSGCQRIYVESEYKHSSAHKFYQVLGYKKSGYYFLKTSKIK